MLPDFLEDDEERALLALFTDLSWEGLASCKDYNPSLWFPGRGQSSRPALKVCADCPVKPECLEYGVVTGQKYGIWGGVRRRRFNRLVKMWRDGIEIDWIDPPE